MPFTQFICLLRFLCFYFALNILSALYKFFNYEKLPVVFNISFYWKC